MEGDEERERRREREKSERLGLENDIEMIQALYIKKFSILPPTLTHPEYFHDYTMANFTIDYRTQNFSTKFDCVYCMQNLYPLERFFLSKNRNAMLSVIYSFRLSF